MLQSPVAAALPGARGERSSELASTALAFDKAANWLHRGCSCTVDAVYPRLPAVDSCVARGSRFAVNPLLLLECEDGAVLLQCALTPRRASPQSPHLATCVCFVVYWYTNLPPGVFTLHKRQCNSRRVSDRQRERQQQRLRRSAGATADSLAHGISGGAERVATTVSKALHHFKAVLG